MPRLATFIRANLEEILAEWESFARGLPAGGAMDIVALRDHAKEMLVVIARDLDRAQTTHAQAMKARGMADSDESVSPTAAHHHGAGRAESGFTIGQMVSEFRALRASVLHLWLRHHRSDDPSEREDIVRFNEAIDQAIAESIAEFSREVAETRDRFLAILSHDLRTPLGAVLMSSQFLLDTAGLTGQAHMLVGRMASSARRMNQLVLDLVEFTRTRLGDSVPIARVEMDAVRMIQDVVAEVAASYPGSTISVATDGDLRGSWDYERLAQALTNLVGNAIQHGGSASPVAITAAGRPEEITIAVHNHGPVIPSSQMRGIFEAMTKGAGDSSHDRRRLGLGLYIVDKIVAAHGGSVDVTSSATDGTAFTMRLPRRSSERSEQTERTERTKRTGRRDEVSAT